MKPKSCVFLLGIVLLFGAVNSSAFPSYYTLGGYAQIRSNVSSDLGNPTLLMEDSTASEYYPTQLTSYYYKTMPSIYQYHVMGVFPFQTTPNTTLYLYSDSGYSNELGVSDRPFDAFEWLVFKGSAVVYPQVSVGFGGDADARVQWDGAFRMYEQEVVASIVNASDFIDVYTFSLFYTNTYNLSLTVPVTGDFDLYLYHLGANNTAGPEDYMDKSVVNETGADENITNYSPTPTTGGDYIAVVLWTSGNGTYTFTFKKIYGNGNGSPPIPAFSGLVSILALASLSFLFYVIRKRNLI